MDRREMLVACGSIGATAALTGTGAIALLSQTACNSKDALTWAGVVVGALDQAVPIFREFAPDSVTLVSQALAVARDLQKALKDKAPNALGLLKQFIAPDGFFNQLISDLGLVADPAQRKVLAGILALAGVALNLIAAGMAQGAAQTPGIIAGATAADPEAVQAIQAAAASSKLEKLAKALRF